MKDIEDNEQFEQSKMVTVIKIIGTWRTKIVDKSVKHVQNNFEYPLGINSDENFKKTWTF